MGGETRWNDLFRWTMPLGHELDTRHVSKTDYREIDYELSPLDTLIHSLLQCIHKYHFSAY